MDIDQKKIIHFKYCNYKGDLRMRTAIPVEIWFGSTEYHKEEQWLLKAFDLEKEENRDFAVRDIKSPGRLKSNC